MPTPPLPRIERFGRAEFLAERWHYEPGEHVTILGKTGSGKTYLAYQLLEVTATSVVPAVVLVMKPKDRTVREWSAAAGFRVVRSWPPAPSIWAPRKPPGYVLWPRHTFDPDRDDPVLYREFRAAMLDSYRRGNRIIFADEATGLTQELGLDRELVTLWTRGRSMACGVWAASQRPAHIPLHAYNAVEHLFLANDPDKRARDRFSEIGGVNPDLLRDSVASLKKFEWLYVCRSGPTLCVVEP
jgi:hypothetical protein